MKRKSEYNGSALLAGIVLVGIMAGLVGALTGRQFGQSNYTISFADFIAVMLSAVTLLITLLGFVLALLAFFGWHEVKERIEQKADARTKSFLEEGFREGNALHAMLEAQAKRATYRGVDSVNPAEDEDENEGDRND